MLLTQLSWKVASFLSYASYFTAMSGSFLTNFQMKRSQKLVAPSISQLRHCSYPLHIHFLLPILSPLPLRVLRFQAYQFQILRVCIHWLLQMSIRSSSLVFWVCGPSPELVCSISAVDLCRGVLSTPEPWGCCGLVWGWIPHVFLTSLLYCKPFYESLMFFFAPLDIPSHELTKWFNTSMNLCNISEQKHLYNCMRLNDCD